MPNSKTAFVFVDMKEFSAAGTKPIDGLSAGKFTSMWGDVVEFKAESLATYAKNTKEVIKSTTTESGEVVGLPIDMDMHDHRGGAGWIKDVIVDAERKILSFMVEWTDEGADVIRRNVRRFFSPSVDLENESVLGGSLTNWPATRDKKTGRILLRPVELSSFMKEIDMPKTLEEIEKEQEAQAKSIEGIMKLATDTNTMLTELSKGLKPAEGDIPEGINPELLALVGNGAGLEELGAKAEEIANDAIRAQKRKGKLVEFAAKIAGGTKERPFGLKVRPADIVALLASLPEKQGNAVMKILEQSLDAAVDFAQHGFDGEGFGNKPQLSDPYIKYAREFCSIEGNTIQEFFKANPEVGKFDDFNLAEFSPKEK
jgi:hypothetical protein